MRLFPLAIGAAELAPWLMGMAVFIGLLARKRRWVVRGVCALSLACSAVPLVSLLASREMRAGAFNAIVPLSSTVGLAQPIQTRDNVIYPVRDGNLHMVVYGPAQRGVYPTIISIYGGAWQRGKPEDDAQFARYMAGHGYVVCAIDYRHAPKFQFPVPLEDVQEGIAFVHRHAAEFQVDPTRVALLGRSSGGHLALLAAYQLSKISVRAVVAYYPPVDLIEGYRDLPVPDPIGVRSVLETFLGGPPSRLREPYLQASPVTYVTHPLPPTLLLQGGRDHIVKPRFARELHHKLQATGTPTVLLEFPWSEHAFDAIFPGMANNEALDYTERFLAWALR